MRQYLTDKYGASVAKPGDPNAKRPSGLSESLGEAKRARARDKRKKKREG